MVTNLSDIVGDLMYLRWLTKMMVSTALLD
jgi:hypothetical protein